VAWDHWDVCWRKLAGQSAWRWHCAAWRAMRRSPSATPGFHFTAPGFHFTELTSPRAGERCLVICTDPQNINTVVVENRASVKPDWADAACASAAQGRRRGKLRTCKRDVDPAWREREPSALRRRNPIDHNAILIAQG